MAEHSNLGFERWFRDEWKRKREGFCFFFVFFLKLYLFCIDTKLM